MDKKERDRIAKAKYRERNREEYNTKMREWLNRNKDRVNSERRLKRASNSEYAEKLRIRDRDRYAKNPDRRKNVRLKSTYGITIEQYYEMYENQDHKCAICKREYVLGSKTGLAVDHCHNEGNIRGLLCANCNNGLGRFEDNIEFLNNAIAYLSKT